MSNKKSEAGKEIVKVAFQGERGAYSESAVYTFFGDETEVKPCRDLTEVFESVDKQEVPVGVVPVENSLEGSVNQTYDLFLTHNLKVSGEVIIRISHCLIANPSTSLEAVKTVYSHPQALAQCRSFLERLGSDLIPTYDTAGSVKLLKEKGLKNAAAVASEKAAEIYGMKILAREIEGPGEASVRGDPGSGEKRLTENGQRQNIHNLRRHTYARLTIPRLGRVCETQHKPHQNRVKTNKTKSLGIQFLPRF